MTLISILYKFIFASTFNCAFFVVWFQTDFLIEYLKLFSLNKLKSVNNFFLLDDYEKAKKENILEILTYTDFLEMAMPADEPSLGKLLSCKYCLGFWLTIFSSLLAQLLVGDVTMSSFIFILPMVYLSSIFLYTKLFEN